jgi:polysaccharide export outer membrane protein
LNQIEKALVSRLGKDFLVNPQITVQVVEFSSKFINVLGAVKSPGGIPLKGPITLLETIAKAGGVNVSQAGKNIIVLRHSGDKKKDVKHITVNLNRLLKEGDLSLNLALRDKDTVFIPEADQIFVFGEVNSPGPYDLTEENFSVVEAISKAGGLTKLAAANRTRIVRVEGGEEFAIEVDVEKIMEGDRSQDQFLKPGDIIVIPEVYF